MFNLTVEMISINVKLLKNDIREKIHCEQFSSLTRVSHGIGPLG